MELGVVGAGVVAGYTWHEYTMSTGTYTYTHTEVVIAVAVGA